MTPRRVAVAYSGGRDSTALLHATARAAARCGVEVLALHVHHGLSARADAWLAHCEAQCAAWVRQGLPVCLQTHRVVAEVPRGLSVEAWARSQRYHALHELCVAAGASLLLLAQHRQDQAETLLLQALRGAGVGGLAGMPRLAVRRGLTWARPWLDQPRAAIEAYVRAYGLTHVDDDSNDDTRYARNRLRARVWPALLEAFPDAQASLADAARHAQAAQLCLAEMAETDVPLVTGSAAGMGRLDVAAWLELPPGRRLNALRHWLHLQLDMPAPAWLIERLLVELPRSGAARWLVDGGELRGYRGGLRYVAVPRRAEDGPHRPEARLSASGPGTMPLPGWGGSLELRRVHEGGVALARLAAASLRERRGGERFQFAPGATPRTLKKQFQSLGLAAWDRGGPLVYDGACLLFVPGLGVDARARAAPGQEQVVLHWIADT